MTEADKCALIAYINCAIDSLSLAWDELINAQDVLDPDGSRYKIETE